MIAYLNNKKINLYLNNIKLKIKFDYSSLLLEDGTQLLLEDGTPLILERN